MLLLDVTPLSLGIEVAGGVTDKIILRNSTVPASATQHYTTQVDGQTNVAIHVLQGERELARDCRSLARFDLRGIPPMVAGMPRIEVKFLIDANGILQVSAREQRSGKEAQIEVQPTYGLTTIRWRACCWSPTTTRKRTSGNGRSLKPAAKLRRCSRDWPKEKRTKPGAHLRR